MWAQLRLKEQMASAPVSVNFQAIEYVFPLLATPDAVFASITRLGVTMIWMSLPS